MSTKRYLTVTALVFLLVALLHLARLVYRLPVQIGTWPVPNWVSYLGLVAATGLCAWSYTLHRR